MIEILAIVCTATKKKASTGELWKYSRVDLCQSFKKAILYENEALDTCEKGRFKVPIAAN